MSWARDVLGARCLGRFARWNDRRLAGLGQRFEHPLVGIEGLVGHEGVRFQPGQKGIRSGQIVLLAASQMEAGRVAERIHQRVDLGGQPALAAADGLIIAGFLGAPAAC